MTTTTPIPGTALVACANVAHRVAFKPKEGCPACKGLASPAKISQEAPRTAPTKRPGQVAEDLLAAQLAEAGFVVVTFLAWMRETFMETTRRTVIREWPWGMSLEPQRRFRSDFGIPAAKLLVEIEGQVHSIKGKRKADILRAQLAASVGYTILRVLPEQVHDKSALALVRGAVEASCGIKVEEVTKEAR